MRASILLFIGFVAGYFTRELMANRNFSTTQIIEKTTGVKNDNSITVNNRTVSVLYRNGRFDPAEISVAYGKKLIIRNDSDSLMWLVSDNPKLQTDRGYGKSEQLTWSADKTGKFMISNKLNLEAKAIVTVK